MRIRLDKIVEYASRYHDPREESIENGVAPQVRARGYCTKEQFLQIYKWKTPRTLHIAKENSPDEIRRATWKAINYKTPERERIETLVQNLRGIAYPTASCFLHWLHDDPYPILDFRALWSLDIAQPKTYTTDFWLSYTTTFRNLMEQSRTDKRTLDRALWQYSKENQSA